MCVVLPVLLMMLFITLLWGYFFFRSEAILNRKAYYEVIALLDREREENAEQIAQSLSREELLSLCEKIADRDNMILSDRLREKGGLPRDPRWKR